MQWARLPVSPPPLLKSATLKSVHILLQCNGCACRVKYPFQGIKDVEEQLARGGVSDCCKCIYEKHCKCGRGHIKNAGSNKHAKAYCKPCDCPCGHTTKHDRKGYKCNPCSCEQQNKCQCHDDHGRVLLLWVWLLFPIHCKSLSWKWEIIDNVRTTDRRQSTDRYRTFHSFQLIFFYIPNC